MKPKVTDVQASGTLDSTTFLRGDGQWAVPAGGTSNYVVINREVIPYTGADETYTVPASVIRLRVHTWGGGGQGGQYGGGAAGAGGYTVAEIAVTPGDTLELQVGQGGQWTGFSTQNPGGWPDGGDGSYGDTSGGGGGGSTRVFNSLNDLLMIAGAGAGAAGYIGTGGVGGGSTGGNASSGGATGGSQSAGGTSGGGGDPGTGPVTYASRTTQRGGNGGPTGSTGTDGGGGGGGYYGGAGGGGDGKAGGGGSGFFDPALVQEGDTLSGAGTVPPATSVTGYVAGVGVGSTSGSGLPGGDGLIVIEEMIEGIALADLYDVDTPAPTDGQVLTFDFASGKWKAVDPTGGGGGGGGGAYELIDDIVLGSTAASVTFASISQDYDHLKMLIEIVSDGVSGDAQINTRFNNDSGANYRGYLQNAFGSGTSTTELSAGLTPTAGGIAFSEVDIFDYSSAEPRKQQLFRSTTQSSTSFNQWGGGYWDDTAAITEIDLIRSNAGNWGIGSRFRLYGWKSTSGGGGGQPWWFQPPAVADFTTAFGGAHGWATLADDTDEGLLFDGGVPEAGDKSIYAYQTIPSPGTDWTLTVRLSVSLPAQNFSAMGIICQNSANSRIIMGALASGGNAWFMKFFNLNPGSYVGEINAAWNGDPKWLRLAKVGSDIIFYVSNEGKIWTEMARQAIATFLAADPDRIGFSVLHNRTTGSQVVGSIQYWNFQ